MILRINSHRVVDTLDGDDSQIYSTDANFGTGIGWTEYFQPFCKEVYEVYHAKYNFHRPPSWKQVLKEVIRMVNASSS